MFGLKYVGSGILIKWIGGLATFFVFGGLMAVGFGENTAKMIYECMLSFITFIAAFYMTINKGSMEKAVFYIGKNKEQKDAGL